MNLTAWIAVVATLVAVWGVVTQRVIARRKATIDYLLRSDTDKDLIDARDVFIRLTKDAGGLARWAEPDCFDTPEAKAIRLTLNENERMAIGLQFGILDIEFIKRHSKGSVISDWQLAQSFVAQIRLRTGRTLLYHEFEDLAMRLQGDTLHRRSYWRRLWF